MAGHKKVVALLVVITCMSICFARPLEPSINFPTERRNNGGGGTLQRALQLDDVVKIKGPYKKCGRIDVDLDDVAQSSSKLQFSKLSKGPISPSGPSPIHNSISTDSISGQHKQCENLQRTVQSKVELDDVVKSSSKLIFSNLSKGPVSPSAPSPIHD